jgi:murein DD-endopeptidase MepM/ murein hydrolase activator NlpD
MVRPARGAITGWWGEGRRTHRHTGIDFDGDTGDPVVSAGTGTVVHAGPAPSGYGGYGQMVLIDHGNGVSTLYAHLSRIRVHVGQTVAPGDDVGAIGTTGSVTGSHLHFEVRIGGTPVNPAPWVAG